jgi:hypothetical protein
MKNYLASFQTKNRFTNSVLNPKEKFTQEAILELFAYSVLPTTLIEMGD